MESLWLNDFPSPEGLAWIEGVADRLADENQEGQHSGHGKEPGHAEPGRLDVILALLEHIAERGRTGGEAETEKIERGERRHRRREDEGQKRHGRHHGV